MLKKENFSENHIRTLQKESGRDPALLERAVYAFGLLEAITRVGMPFIFKGGTSLLLTFEHPRRLSTDIDIVVAPATPVDAYIRKASELFPFLSVEEQLRVGKNDIEKRHFKFTYESPVTGKSFYILLDILFEKNHYVRLVKRPIKNELLLTEPPDPEVTMPSTDCLLGDKLTAFAPHTTGIRIGTGRDMEIMKQMFDICALLEKVQNFQEVRTTYTQIANAEAAYRGLALKQEDILQDTFEAAKCIASRGRLGSNEDYRMYLNGIRSLSGHIYAEKFTPETAAGSVVRIMYLCACLLKGAEYTAITDYREYVSSRIEMPQLRELKYFKKVNPLAYAYLIKTDRLLTR